MYWKEKLSRVRTIISTSHRLGMFETPKKDFNENFQKLKKLRQKVAPDC